MIFSETSLAAARAVADWQPDKLMAQALDGSPDELLAAHINYERLRRNPAHGGIEWCNCPTSGAPAEVYYRNARNGSHGWLCVRCHGVTQAG